MIRKIATAMFLLFAVCYWSFSRGEIRLFLASLSVIILPLILLHYAYLLLTR